MANTYRTPGVYVQEISTLPGTVAEVKSAIPAFIGYTEKIRYEGRSLKGIPEHIDSLKAFEERFGKSADIDLKKIKISTNTSGRFSRVDSISFNKRFLLYEAIYMYFINGGGECYVVSTGSFKDNPSYDPELFKNAIDSLNIVDDITLIVMPEAVLLGSSLYGVQQKALKHCATRMNRFAILDIKESVKESVGIVNEDKSILLNWKNAPEPDAWESSYKEFREMVGVMNLSYGATYTPYIIADTPTNFRYENIKNYLFDSSDTPKKLLLSNLDPDAYDAVTYLDKAIQDQANLREAIESAKYALRLVSKDTVTKPTLRKAVLQAYGTDGKNIIAVGNILTGLLSSLAPSLVSSPHQNSNQETDIEKYLGINKKLEEKVKLLINAKAEEFETKKKAAKEEAENCEKSAKNHANSKDSDLKQDITTVGEKIAAVKDAINKLAAEGKDTRGDTEATLKNSIGELNFLSGIFKKYIYCAASPLSEEDEGLNSSIKVYLDSIKDLGKSVQELSNADKGQLEAKKTEASNAAGECQSKIGKINKDKGPDLEKDITTVEAKIAAVLVAIDKLGAKDPKAALEKSIVELNTFSTAFSLKYIKRGAYPLSEDLVRHISVLLARLVPKLKDLCTVTSSNPGGQTATPNDSFESIVMKIDHEKVTEFANLLESPLSDDIYDTIKKNIGRLSDGISGTSSVYRAIHAAMQKALRVQPPSAAMAGLYATTDNARGVWKAPANISISNCLGLTQNITAKTQEELNIDSVAGKSINALRNFTGKGFLVWGARTLDGNSQEWRYIPVRRFFLMVEESVRRATASSVFEPNDANLWSKVKAIIDNYLLQKWKDGALMGASAAEAYFVNIGLGSTMTEQDILDGRLIVDIGMAVVRPAEFVVLRFMHKMQQ